MKRLVGMLVGSVSLLVLAGAARADTIIDPLHGYDVINGVATNTDTGTISPLTAGDGFGFAVSPPQDSTGVFSMAILIPTNDTASATYSLTGTFAGTTGASLGVWSSGTLESFLTAAGVSIPSASPPNQFSALGGSVDTADPTVTGFKVFYVTFNGGANVTLHGEGNLANDGEMDFANLPTGAEIVGFLDVNGNTIDTASSNVLMVNATVAPTPIPGAIWLFGGGLGLLGALGKRKRKPAASVFA